jgi:hypothetical protein
MLVGMHLLTPEKVLTEGARRDLAGTASYKVFWKSSLRLVRPAAASVLATDDCVMASAVTLYETRGQLVVWSGIERRDENR